MKLPTRPAPRAPGVPKSGPRVAVPRRPPLPFQVDSVPDPLAGMQAADNDVEAQSVEALDLVQQAFRDREKKLITEVADYRPIEFFRVLVFATPAQAQAFATAVGEDVHLQYMDGRKICDRLGIEIPKDLFKPKKSLTAPSKRLAAIAMPLPAKRTPPKPG